jgi:hypothetical protein
LYRCAAGKIIVAPDKHCLYFSKTEILTSNTRRNGATVQFGLKKGIYMTQDERQQQSAAGAADAAGGGRGAFLNELISGYSHKRPCVHHWGVEGLAEATFDAIRLARMQVREYQFDWVARTIGPARVDACLNLRKYARHRPAAGQN